MNIIYVFIVALFLLDSLPCFDIKSQGIKSSIYFGLLIGTPLTLIWNALVIKTRHGKIIWTILPTTFLIIILIVGPVKFIYSIGSWQTQTILYQNRHFSFRTVEFQMQDVGAFGYNKRTVEVFYLTPLFMITGEIPNDEEKRIDWIKVDKYVNELGLKGG
ncbi:MAG: hypothetical protein A2W93_02495 [Bacteroidetes bacterium GWF2_43_63]|nr:MAG: hypothetical protein A2W94_08505 [Bacteroidetes bacterium GWE2_42_42]OFY53539.1 MAG: hypothetical protein A2W93_02495 [Bacteroidetes bacterium GWF2_43_63]HBG71131.1 hypothetical protein [Bacteroidales bacterium]HCB63708.1 hypothetical protein [Bacteroidales bacterium]HCY24457.1 hypothetical protein [Bacteroidales bacterium]